MNKNIQFFDYNNPKDNYIYSKVEEYLRAKKEVEYIPFFMKEFYPLLVYMKYIIEEKHLSYQEILQDDPVNLGILHDEIANNLKDFIMARLHLEHIYKNKLYHALKYMAFEDYNIPRYEDEVLYSYVNNNRRYVLLYKSRSCYIPYIPLDNVDIYYPKYITPTTKRRAIKCLEYYIYDLILGIKRYMYSTVNELNDSRYEDMIFINQQPSFVDSMEYLNKNDIRITRRIFTIYDYKHISTLKRSTLTGLESIMINNNKAYLLYDFPTTRTPDRTISIKDITRVVHDKLANKPFDDYINAKGVDVTPEEISKHHYRIGVSIYQNDKKLDKVIMCADKNRYITSKIEKLNEDILNKIDELIVR